jgi:uncharacterized protein
METWRALVDGAIRYILDVTNRKDTKPMTTTNARVPTANGGKYVLQLGKHWAHKLDVAFEGERTVIRFPDAVATFDPGPDAIAVSISSDDPETVEG